MIEFIDFLKHQQIEYIEEYLLASHSTMRVGGRATIAVFPTNETSLSNVLNKVKDKNFRFIVIGNGSNVIFDDKGYAGVVIFTDKMKSINQRGNVMYCECGVSLAQVVSLARQSSLTGAEFLTGIPGTIGGGIYMNCGAFGHSISELVTSVNVYDNGQIRTYTQDELKFSFRHSVFSESNKFIIGAWLRFQIGNAESIDTQISTYQEKRALQPTEYPSAGSVFLPANEQPAWALIDGAGLRGKTIGGACVSKKHAGFIVNQGNATSSDIRKLIEIIQEEVMKKYGVLLQTEIIFIGE